MKVIKYELVVGVDIDNTLLMWDNPTINDPGKLPIEFAGKTVFLTPHTYHIDLVKTYNERGYYIIFWSANGYKHCQRAVEALGLQEYADGERGHIQVKLTKHLDDNTNAASVLGPRVYEDDLTKPVEDVKIYFLK